MRNDEANIDTSQVLYFINKLTGFMGENNIEKCLKRYKFSLDKSSPIYRDYYLKKRHPWWETLIEVDKIISSGKVLKNNLTQEIITLAGDAKKITTLQQYMPDLVREKYKRDLLDNENANNYLFELVIAWHFYLQGASIEWYEKEEEKQPEYLVKTSAFEFNVECKRINIDLAKKIKRKDFYKFSDLIIPEIEKRKYSGKIEIILKGRFEEDGCFLDSLKAQILQVIDGIKPDDMKGEQQISMGKMSYDLATSDGKTINIRDYYANLIRRKPENAHAVLFAEPINNQFGINPIEIIISSEKKEDVVEAIRYVISGAGKDQLYCDKPGLIACFLEGIEENDLEELKSKSVLQVMTCDQLSKPKFSHVMGISYTAEQRISNSYNVSAFNYPRLLFANPTCKYETAKKYALDGLELDRKS
jgi:hypothetical protein